MTKLDLIYEPKLCDKTLKTEEIKFQKVETKKFGFKKLQRGEKLPVYLYHLYHQ